MKGIIYMWTCNISGKSYIGQTTNEKKREQDFLNENDSYTTESSRINSARKKYGLKEGTWTKIVLKRLWCNDGNENALKERLALWEKYFIKKFDTFNNGYNSTDGGEFNKQLSKETLEKLRKASLKMWNKRSKDFKISEGKRLVNESIKYHNKNGNHVTLEVSIAISKSQKKAHENNPNRNYNYVNKSAKKVAMIDEQGKVLKIYPSIHEASINENVWEGGIRNVCFGRKEITKGTRWKFLDEEESLMIKQEKGYTWHKKLKRWHVKIKIHGKTYSLGYFKKEETAKEMRKIAKKKVKDGEFFEWYENIPYAKYEIMKKMGEV